MLQRTIFFVAIGGTVFALLNAELPEEEKSASTASVVQARSAKPAFAGDEMVLERGRSGQFTLTARIDGQDTDFLVDTGADVVALTVDEADRLGLAIDPSSFRPITQTAAGPGNGTVVRLATLEVAGTELHDVDALVLEGLPLNLLGQNALSQLGQVSLEGNRMVIRH